MEFLTQIFNELMNIINELMNMTFEDYIFTMSGFLLSVGTHEFSHFLAYLHYKAQLLLLKYKGKRCRVLCVTPKDGDKFYIDLYEKDPNNAWKKELLISGSGLFVTLCFTLLIFTSYFPLQLIGVSNVLLFVMNCRTNTSDGYKIYLALKERKNYINRFQETFEQDEASKKAFDEALNKELEKSKDKSNNARA